MSQHDMNIANSNGATVRADLNAALVALAGQNSGATAPTTTYPFMLWADTTNDTLWMRNAANSGWIDKGALSGVNAPLSNQPLLAAFPIHKADLSSVAFTKTAAGSASIKAGTKVEVAGTLVQFPDDTAITMPVLTAGTDYAIWVKTDGTIQADASFSTAPGTGNWRKIGGFHYAPGGNATAMAGGDAIPAINEYSFWDLKFKPACPDPRGMTLVADSFWVDIYLLGVDHPTNGTSKYNVTIADGNTPPKIPTKFGGNGTTAYTTLNWWEANEVLQSHGKRQPTYDEFAALAYGTTEATGSGGTDVPTTGVTGTGATSLWNVFTSKWGVIQSTGCKWVWGRNFGGGTQTGWVANTGGRGSTLQLENVSIFGGAWESTPQSGSRCSNWSGPVPTYYASTTTRGICNHLIIE